MRTITLIVPALLLVAVQPSYGQEPAPARSERGSLVEDRAARKLLAAGDARDEADEIAKAVEIWQSVIERYPRSGVRYKAHMRLGNYFLERDRAYDRARVHFDAIAAEDNPDDSQRAEAMLKMGICFYHVRNYGKSFQVLRSVIEQFSVGPQVNQAYYYIGLGHFQLGHYSRAISALEKVGTTLADGEDRTEKLEAGKRFFVRIEDADLAVLDSGEAVDVQCHATTGDVETVKCFPVGRNVRVVLGSIPTRLGTARPGNGRLEVSGNDQVTVTYVDQHTAEKELDRKVLNEVSVVGNAHVQITDGAFNETLQGVVLGKNVNIQVADADRDVTSEADTLTALVEIYRHKTDEEMDAEAAAAAAVAEEEVETDAADQPTDEELLEPKIDPLKRIDRVEVTLVEVKVKPPVTRSLSDEPGVPAQGEAADVVNPEGAGDAIAEENQPLPEDDSIHSGVFRAVVSLQKADDTDSTDRALQALPGDLVRLVYLDERHRSEGVRQLQTEAKCLEGNIGGVRVTRAVISDQELRLRTKLKTASALTNIGNRYKDFGLKENATRKYQQALEVCEDIMSESRNVGGRLLEETYVQLWHIYFEMDRLYLAAAMCERLQREFPTSGFVDDALLQLADVARKQGELNRAIGIYNRLVNMKTSQLRGEAQFGIAACYEQMAEDAPEGPGAGQLFDRAFQEYKKVFDQFPESGRVGEAVSKMANYYYQQKDYGRAIDTFETVLSNHPDAKFLDVILFNYGRCLYRMQRKQEARRRFDQLIGDYPESALAPDAKRISEALAKSGS